ncbi:MAG: hypothetical protein V4520_10625 [Bacteroidota bacterium]
MEIKRYKIFTDVSVIAVMLVYFFVAATHIFFIPRQNVPLITKKVSGNSIFKRKKETFANVPLAENQIKRPDKSIFEDKNTTADAIKSVMQFFVLLLFIPLAWQRRPKFLTSFLSWSGLPRHTFLSLQIIRI